MGVSRPIKQCDFAVLMSIITLHHDLQSDNKVRAVSSDYLGVSAASQKPQNPYFAIRQRTTSSNMVGQALSNVTVAIVTRSRHNQSRSSYERSIFLRNMHLRIRPTLLLRCEVGGKE